jgi:hypothetical protein
MTTFDDRERAFETKFALDQEQEFRAISRRNKLLGQWAGEQLGLSGAELEDYARSVVRSDFAEAGDDDVERKVAADLQGKVDAGAVRAKMNELLDVARGQIATSG